MPLASSLGSPGLPVGFLFRCFSNTPSSMNLEFRGVLTALCQRVRSSVSGFPSLVSVLRQREYSRPPGATALARMCPCDCTAKFLVNPTIAAFAAQYHSPPLMPTTRRESQYSACQGCFLCRIRKSGTYCQQISDQQQTLC